MILNLIITKTQEKEDMISFLNNFVIVGKIPWHAFHTKHQILLKLQLTKPTFQNAGTTCIEEEEPWGDRFNSFYRSL